MDAQKGNDAKIGWQSFALPSDNLDLLSDAELGDDSSVTLDVVLCQVVQQTAALTDHLEQALTGVVVLLVDLQVLGELVDALGKDSDLNLGRTGVVCMGLVGFDYSSLLLFGDHFLIFLSFI